MLARHSLSLVEYRRSSSIVRSLSKCVIIGIGRLTGKATHLRSSQQQERHHHETQKHTSIFVPERRPMEDYLVHVWSMYDRELNAFLVETGSEGQGKRASLRKVLPIHARQGSAWIKKSQTAGLDVETGHQRGYGDLHKSSQTQQSVQAQRGKHIDNTAHHNLPAPVQDRNIVLGPTINTTDQRFSNLQSVQQLNYRKGTSLKGFEQADSSLHTS